MSKIAVTSPEYDKAEAAFAAAAAEGCECLRGPSGEAELADFIRTQHVRHVIVGVAPYTGALYDALPAGGVIARFGVGHDGIDKQRATGRGLLCTNTPGVLDDSVAELTVALLLAAARHVPAQVAAVRRGEWQPTRGSELRGKTLAIIGCGAIGRRVARTASSGFGMRVVGCDVSAMDARSMRQDWGFAEIVGDFAAAASGADYVSLHIPSTPVTHHFMDQDRLALLPPHAWLINTARGAVVDEAASFDALAGGKLAGAALDVFENEPYVPVVPDKDLRSLPNVIMTPHVGSSTREACHRMARRALQNTQLAEAGRFDEMDLLNPSVLHSGG